MAAYSGRTSDEVVTSERVEEIWSPPVSVDTGSLGRSSGVVDSLVLGW